MSKIKNGKKPISSRSSSRIARNQIYGSPMDLPEALIEELESQGLEYRFLAPHKINKFTGKHKSGWEAYKVKDYDKIASEGFKFGADPDGLIRCEELVLGVKPKEKAELHRDYLAQRSAEQAKVSKQKAQELKRMARAENLNIKVIDTYED